MRSTIRLFCAAVLLAPVPALADAAAGAAKIKSAGCIQCHGRDGVSKLPEAPNLAGQVQTYLQTSLAAYKSGERKNELMNTVAANLTEADMADLAAYYASIQVQVTPPPKP